MSGGSGFYYWLSFPHSLTSLTHDFELWRVVTPAFMHFSALHLLLNLIAFYWLLSQWPKRWSSLRLVACLAGIAAASNLAQYLWAGPAFGGLSGVVFGLAGLYIGGAIVARYRPGRDSVPPLSLELVGILLLTIALGFAGILPNLADMAHLAGLLAGLLMGITLVLLSPAEQSVGQSF